MSEKYKVYTVAITVPAAALKNFQRIIEAETGFKVTDPLALITAQMQLDADGHLESYGYFVSEGDTLYEDEYPGLDKGDSELELD